MEENSMKQGMPKSFRIDLSTARDGVLMTVKGKIVRIADASDGNALISVALHENIPDRFERLQKTGKLRDDDGFDVIYISNTAQANKWVRLIVSEGAYDVETPVTNTIDSITNPVNVQNTISTQLFVAFAAAVTVLTNTAIDSAATYAISTTGATHTGVTFQNSGPSNVFVGNSSVVATLQSSGKKIRPGETFSYDGQYALRATCAAGKSSNLRITRKTSA